MTGGGPQAAIAVFGLTVLALYHSRIMSGETNLEQLLRTLKPALRDEEFAFCTLPESDLAGLSFRPLCTFVETEGTTVICTGVEAARDGLKSTFPCRMITLTVHSSLEAVGLTAAVTSKLAEAGISANVVAAFYHDHVFVPANRADEAMKILLEFSK